MKKLILPFVFILTIFSVHAQINLGGIKLPTSLPGTSSSGSKPTTVTKTTSLTESEIINGLKEALTKGATTASSQLNQANGFWGNPLVKIPFPEDCKMVASTLRQYGYGKKVDEFELTLNRAAEKAAKEAAPIFVNAIKQMSISDGKNILFGADTAATHFLRKNTSNPLYTAFVPHVKTALDQTSATRLWKDLTKTYNKIPMVKKVDTDLPRYTTNKALKGLFVVVAQEEKKIRKDPVARTSEVLQNVFGELGK